MDFVRIQPGSFLMGSGDEKDRARVTLSQPFHMGVTQVTQEQWEVIMGENPSLIKRVNLPVVWVSWDDCQAYARKLDAKVDGAKFSLPTEAQWEYACRAGTSTKYYFGDNAWENDKHVMTKYARTRDTSSAYIQEGCFNEQPVRMLSPNAWGLYDMHGNVSEWCLDYYGDPLKGSLIDPQPPAPSGCGYATRVIRGGSWRDEDGDCCSSYRTGCFKLSDSNVGLRLVCYPAHEKA